MAGNSSPSYPEGLTGFVLKSLVLVILFLAGQWVVSASGPGAGAKVNERMATLEARVDAYKDQLDRIESKMDRLLEHKGEK